MILRMTSKEVMTVEYLKYLFMEKYGDAIFPNGSPEVMVMLTSLQFKELNDDLMKKSKDPILLMIDESDLKDFNPEMVYWTRIVIPYLCQFIVQVGEDFQFRLLDTSQEFGDEDL